MDKIKVLWMNNGDEGFLSFIEGTPLNNFLITTCCNMKECRLRLANHNQEAWEVVIINAEPRMDNVSEPKVGNLRNAYFQIYDKYGPPVYIVSNNKEMNYIDRQVATALSGNRFYMLQETTQQLYDEIVKVVGDNEEAIIKREYETVYNFYVSISDTHSDELLMNLLKRLKNEKVYKDPTIPGIVRLILDTIMIYLNNIGFLPITFEGSNLGECSKWLGKAKEMVPLHVQRCFHSCVEISNNGDHQIPKETKTAYEKRISNPMYVQKQISDCKAIYLNKALIYDLLNILYWCATLNKL